MPSNVAENFSEDAQILIEEAEDKFKHQKLQEAYRLAILAKLRYPQFDGIDKFVTAYAVHIRAMKKKPKGDIDFYGVLGISDTLADTHAIKRSYNKLALMIHPDKNPSAAADGAFKLILAAWEVLSEPSKRQDYDIRWGLRSSSKKPRSSNSPDGADSRASSYEGRTCPICGQWCKYGRRIGRISTAVIALQDTSFNLHRLNIQFRQAVHHHIILKMILRYALSARSLFFTSYAPSRCL
ncbi:hypothetical protein L1049_017192 [Liquidambar formosana]|uniref:J domain-containing protein n=1 Tax=Liquidambar formosana TaxID=63359 RepID=A0AAP0X794_LIQFO